MLYEFTHITTDLRNYYIEKLDAVVNKLEYLATAFTCKLADDKMIYQSVHQSYLQIIQMLYGRIVAVNEIPGKDKYYTNLITLYNLWAKMDYDVDYCIRERETKIQEQMIQQRRNDITTVDYE